MLLCLEPLEINVRGASSDTNSGPEPIHAFIHLDWSGQLTHPQCKDTFLDKWLLKTSIKIHLQYRCLKPSDKYIPRGSTSEDIKHLHSSIKTRIPGRALDGQVQVHQ